MEKSSFLCYICRNMNKNMNKKFKRWWSGNWLNFYTHMCKNNLVETKKDEQGYAPFDQMCRKCGEPF